MKFGIPYLFLSPEYLGEVNWLAFLILGFSVGGFFMAFHLYSYILIGPAFPFIATLARPFFKFCINNSVIPVIFYIVHCYNILDVQGNEELRTTSEVLIQILSLTAGIILFIVFSVLYFFRTNWDISKLQLRKKNNKRSLYFFVGTLFSKKKFWFESHHARVYQPSYYIANFKKILPARDAEHYKRETLKEVFRQNQLNASFFELAIIMSFFMLGYFGDYSLVQIPSSASFMLLCTFALMVLTIFYSWFRGWAITLIAITALMINVISAKTDFLQVKNYAYGINYTDKQPYNLDAIKEIQFDSAQYVDDIHHHENILEHWYDKATMAQNTDKPKLVMINCSGGGLRSAMWTFYVMQQLNDNSQNQFYQSVHLITGASGGMIGASYYRELELLSQTMEINPADEAYLKNISKDLLNSVSFNLVMNDIFMRFKKKTFPNGQSYVEDRGYSFEAQLNENTEHILAHKRLVDYRRPEMSGQTPLMLFTPTIVNDGRRLLIGSQPYGFMNGPLENKKFMGPENVEFIKLFDANVGQSVKFTSVLRMNSTFPYILPMVTMPTEPEIQIMDAGIRDNYGTKTTIRYLKGMKEWIKENTSGVVLVEIRDIQKDYDMVTDGNMSLVQRFFKPVTNFYGNYHHSQEYNATELVETIEEEGFPVDVVTFVLRKDPSEMISLSWHLTQREKNDIRRIFNNEYNQNQMEYLIDLLKQD
ncbi:patatin-like phospholipase family protein [Paracrocinitomix mangrovi]|uniref:patatin-like phospholipase family protein n=1 Tax=Paracrocinitomix mangrovi TaxID=2862509 RepID=UPI001C8E18B7|nr:patatin-like phospholipase family protein [Paracrocinitomix mangrovi]UKN02547.1 patatin-like phospholipase family protein [Paracrocinitomix mangrovi]